MRRGVLGPAAAMSPREKEREEGEERREEGSSKKGRDHAYWLALEKEKVFVSAYG